MKNLKRLISSLLTIMLVFSLLGCKKEEEIKVEEEIKKVAYHQVELGSLVSIYKTSGVIKAKSETNIASEASGKVAKIFVSEGNVVNKNDVLLLIDSSGNNATLNLETARVMLKNAEEMFNLTKISTENDEKSLQLSVEQAEIAFESAKKTDKSVNISVDEQVKSAKVALNSSKTNLEIAQNNLKDLEENLEKKEVDLFETAENIFSSAMIIFSNSLQVVDSTLGISEKHKNDNDAYERLLSVRNPNLLIEAKNKFLPTNSSYLSIKDYFNNIENYKADNELQNLVDIEVANNILQEAGEVGRNIRQLLYILNDILQNSITDAYFTKAQLDGIKASVSGLQSSLEAQFSAFTVSSQAISNFIIQRPQSLTSATLAVQSAENAYKQAEHSLANLEASLNVQTVGTESQIEIAKKNLESAKLALENVKKKNNLSIQNAKSARDNAVKSYDSALLAYSKMTVLSPIAGTITKNFIEVGNNINMGSMLFTISDISSLNLEVSLNPEESKELKEGSNVDIYIDTKKIIGKIDKISPTADESTRKVKIEIKVPNNKKDIYPNVFASAEIKGKTRKNILKIPLSALIIKSPPTVFLIDANTIKYRRVELGEQNGTFIEILSGLEEGDKILKEKIVGLEEGDKIELIETNVKEVEENIETEKLKKWILKPTDQSSWETSDTEFLIEGIFPKETEKIMVNGYMLQKFNPQDNQWSYNVSTQIGNLSYDKNTYVVEMFDKNDKIIATDEIEVVLNK